MKSTNSLFSRLLVIGLAGRHIDRQTTISDYEFNAISPVLCKPDVQHQAQGSRALMNKFIIIDDMAVVQAIIHTGKLQEHARILARLSVNALIAMQKIMWAHL